MIEFVAVFASVLAVLLFFAAVGAEIRRNKEEAKVKELEKKIKYRDEVIQSNKVVDRELRQKVDALEEQIKTKDAVLRERNQEIAQLKGF